MSYLCQFCYRYGVFIACLLPAAPLAQTQQRRQTTPDTVKTLQAVQVQTAATTQHKADNVITLSQVAMPSAVIDRKTISLMGSRRLDEVMREQTGVAIVSNLGAGNRSVGVQMQGFSSEYVTILIDGQPMAGRNSGNLDLSRISITHIERIEIIKGASSSLYGSEAMGGVINIITRQHVTQPQATVRLTAGTNKTADVSAETETSFARNKGVLFASGSYYTTGGFNVNPYLEKGSQTAPPYHSLSLMARGRYQLWPSGTLHISARYANRRSNMTRDYGVTPGSDRLNENDLNVMAALESRLTGRTRMIARYYLTRYHSNQLIAQINGNHTVQQDRFNENIHRAEWQVSHQAISNQLSLIGGTGGEYQHVHSTVQGSSGNMYNYFAYAQANYTPLPQLGIIAGARYDGNNLYGGRVNPSLGVRYTPVTWLTLRSSVGSGYRPPGYRQLYQVFTNMMQGYTVVGANVFAQSIQQLKASGLVQQVWPVAADIQNLRAETSTSVNAGFSVRPLPRTEVSVNLFYNHIRNLINTQQVGIKTNGSQLYSYINVARAYTKGLEAGIETRPGGGFTIAAGYQLLYTGDLAVKDSIQQRSPRYDSVRSFPSPRASAVKDYFGLPNRSRHMANVQVFYQLKPWGLYLSARATWRGKYGFLDTDNNGFIDPYDVFVKGYTLVNASLQKKLLQNRLTLQLTLDNITNYTDYLMPAQPGRMLLAGVCWCFKKDKTQE